MKTNILLFLMMSSTWQVFGQYQTDKLSVARSNIAVDFIGDTIMFVGGDDTDIVDFYNAKNGAKTQGKYANSDAFSNAKVASSDKYSLFYNLSGVNLVLRDLYIYNKEKGEWSDAISNVGGKFVEIVGNKVYSYIQKDSINVFDLITKNKSKVAFPVKENNFSVCRSEDMVFVVGGEINNASSNNIHIFDTKLNSWTTSKIARARSRPNVIYHENKVIIVDGFNDFSDKLEIFDVTTKTSVEISLKTSVDNPIIIAKNDELLVGAGDRERMMKIDLKNLTCEQPYVLELSANFSGLRSLKGAIIGNRAIFAGDRFPRIHIFDFETDKWSIINLPSIINNASVFRHKEKLYIAGGKDETLNQKSDQILIFDNLTIGVENSLVDNEDILLYPNPSSGLIQYESKKYNIISHTMVNNLGCSVIEGNSNELNIGALPPGTYYLLLKSSTNITFVKRVVKN